MQIPISQIENDERISPRGQTDAETVHRYAQAMQSGVQFPPITVGKTGNRYILIDGRHRCAASKALNRTMIEALVTNAALGEWFEEAIRANVSNGLPLSNNDRSRIVARLKERGYDIDRISKVMALPSAVVGMMLHPKVVSQLPAPVPTQVVRATTMKRVALDLPRVSTHAEGAPPIRMPAVEAFSQVIELLEADSYPEYLIPMERRLYEAFVDWTKRRTAKMKKRT